MSGTPGQPVLPTGAAKWTVTSTVMLALFTYTLNTKSTVLQANQITQALALDRYKAQWITGPENVIGLVAIFAALHFMRVFGIRLLFVAGAACLTLGSVGTMLSQNGWQEAVSGSVRSVTSLYAIPALTLLMQMFPRRKGITYCTCLAFVYGGQVLAEPLGGLIAFNPSWRAGFGIIAALGAWFVVCGWFLLPDDRPSRWPAQSFDWLGVFLFTALLSFVLVLLYRGNYLGWWISTPIWLTIGGVCLALVLFIWREAVAGDPFINLRALSFRTVAVTTAAA